MIGHFNANLIFVAKEIVYFIIVAMEILVARQNTSEMFIFKYGCYSDWISLRALIILSQRDENRIKFLWCYVGVQIFFGTKTFNN